MSWNDERVELLKKLWADGMTASQISAALGGVTRNAVIGKIHRLGLSGRTKTTADGAPAGSAAPEAEAETLPPIIETVAEVAVAAPEPVAPPAAPRILQAEPEIAPVRPAPVIRPAMPKSEVVVPFVERTTIMTLTANACRWPIGDPGSEGFHFCGKRSQPGIPYCTEHARIAYQPSADRRRRA